jgi:hypothetical protein
MPVARRCARLGRYLTSVTGGYWRLLAVTDGNATAAITTTRNMAMSKPALHARAAATIALAIATCSSAHAALFVSEV